MSKKTTVWKDITSYSRYGKDRTPSIWEYNNGTVRVSVVGRHRDYPEHWVMNCRTLGISTKVFAIKSECNTEQAQKLALRIVRKQAADIVESLND